jgi:hypothetical protein
MFEGSASLEQCLIARLYHPSALGNARRGPRFRAGVDV